MSFIPAEEIAVGLNIQVNCKKLSEPLNLQNTCCVHNELNDQKCGFSIFKSYYKNLLVKINI